MEVNDFLKEHNYLHTSRLCFVWIDTYFDQHWLETIETAHFCVAVVQGLPLSVLFSNSYMWKPNHAADICYGDSQIIRAFLVSSDVVLQTYTGDLSCHLGFQVALARSWKLQRVQREKTIHFLGTAEFAHTLWAIWNCRR